MAELGKLYMVPGIKLVPLSGLQNTNFKDKETKGKSWLILDQCFPKWVEMAPALWWRWTLKLSMWGILASGVFSICIKDLFPGRGCWIWFIFPGTVSQKHLRNSVQISSELTFSRSWTLSCSLQSSEPRNWHHQCPEVLPPCQRINKATASGQKALMVTDASSKP